MLDSCKVYCLMCVGGSLCDDIRDALFDTAQDMIYKQKPRWRLKRREFEGEVTTKGKTACIGGLSGIVFYGIIETEKRKIKISYIVRRSDLRTFKDDMDWCPASWADLEPENVGMN